jgi:hypothetical protein
MNHAATLLSDVGKRIEPELQKQLGGLFGGIVRAYLPQAWVLETDEGTATLVVDRNGVASVTDGGAEKPDVTIRGSYAVIAKALTSKSRTAPHGVTATPHTPKGQTAFDYLRNRVGL